MVKSKRIRRDIRGFFLPSAEAIQSACNANRPAEWLVGCEYESLRWTVCDTNNREKTRTIDFAYAMPNGKTLCDFPEFLKATREFAFWIRSPRYSRISDAETHAATVQFMMMIVHGLALDGLTSFKSVSRKYLKVFIERIKHAGDGILKAAERLDAWIKEREHLSASQFRALLPLQANGHYWRLQTGEFFEEIGIPIGAAKFPRVAHFVSVIRNRAEISKYPEEIGTAPPARIKPHAMTIHRFLSTLETLFYMRHVIDAIGINERPFDFSITAFARKHGVPNKPTPLPPPHLALHLMSHAMVWVLNYSDDLLRLHDAAHAANAANAEQITTGPKSKRRKFREIANHLPTSGPQYGPWPLCENTVRGVEGLSMHAALSMLFVACMIVIATFSARRLEELRQIEVGDIKRDGAGQLWLRSYIQKTIMGKEWIPTADIVHKAFNVLTRLSSISRQDGSNKLIARWTTPFISGGRTIISGWNKENINQFAKAVGTPMIPGSSGEMQDWVWNSHQFRRFFAVLYFYRYRGTIDDLAYFLRHLDLEMTRKYLTITPDQAKSFRDIEGQYHRSVAADILTGKGDKVGAGRELKRQLQLRFQKGLRVSAPSEDEAVDFLARQMRTRRWVMRPRAWGDCTCPSDKTGTKSAMCRASPSTPGLGPHFASSAPSVCAGCPHLVDNGHLTEQLQMEELGYRELADSELLRGTLVGSMAQARVITLQRSVGAPQ